MSWKSFRKFMRATAWACLIVSIFLMGTDFVNSAVTGYLFLFDIAVISSFLKMQLLTDEQHARMSEKARKLLRCAT